MELIQQYGNINASILIEYVKHFGVWAPLAAFLLFALQAALPIFPYVILAAAAGMIFGFKMGFVLSWSGALAGACIAFGLCRLLGGEWARKTIYKYWGYDINRVDREMAFWTILTARIIPVIPTPVINVAAALSKVPFWNFFFSSAIGKMPTAFLYTGLGICLFNTKDIKIALLILGGVIAAGVFIRFFTRNRLSFSSKH